LKRKENYFEKAKIKFQFDMETFNYCEIYLNNVEFDYFNLSDSGIKDDEPDLYFTYIGTISTAHDGDRRCKTYSSKIKKDTMTPLWTGDDLPMATMFLSWEDLKRESLRIDIKYAKTGFDKIVGKARV
jgi:hypothetical protein